MALKNTFAELAIKNARKQQVMVDTITEESPIYASIPSMAASDGFFNSYEDVTNVQGGDITELDAPYPQSDVDSRLLQEDLSVIKGIVTVGEDKYNMLGADVAFGKKMDPIMRKTNQNAEISLYNRMQKKSNEYGKLINQGGNANNNYSMIFITYRPGQNIGLYNAAAMGRGIIYETADTGRYQDIDVATGKKRWVYSRTFRSNFGLQLAQPKNISGIVNIDINTVDFTQLRDNMYQAYTSARMSGINSAIYMSAELLTYLNQNIESTFGEVDLYADSREAGVRVRGFNGVPIIDSYNLTVENNVTLL